jgi:NAD(P)-dependent dehydrogenase (short-subunit alcohol dehydrogenase family)
MYTWSVNWYGDRMSQTEIAPLELGGEVAVVTGAGRGLGREHALALARHGARVVVNDLEDSEGSAESVVADIVEAGGQAVVNHDDISTWQGGEGVVASAIDTFGSLSILVNNAGILRDRAVTNMSEAEWDSVIAVHMKGHFCPTRHAAAYWRDEAKAERLGRAAIVNTTSTSGLFGQYGQTNYASAKAGIATMTMVLQAELGRYGVAVNCIAPAARTRLTSASGHLDAPEEGFDIWDPANVSAAVVYLASPACQLRGRVLFVVGGDVHLMEPWHAVESVSRSQRWDPAELASVANKWAERSLPVLPPLPGQRQQ